MRKCPSVVPLFAVLFFGCTAEPDSSVARSPFKPVADVRQLMEMVIDPAADAVWDSVGTVTTIEGTDEWFPETDEEWAAVRYSAMTLAESGNLLMIGERLKDPGAWTAMSQQLVEAGLTALQAADKRDPAAILAAGEIIYFACENCHATYWTEQNAPASR